MLPQCEYILYIFLSIVSFRTYGVVLKARHKDTGQLVAVKKFKESDDDEQVGLSILPQHALLSFALVYGLVPRFVA